MSAAARTTSGACTRRGVLGMVAAGLTGLASGPAAAGSYEDFFRSIYRDDPRGVTTLLLRGFDPNTLDPNGRSAMHLALRLESYRAAEALVSGPGFEVDAQNASGETPLMLAALKGQLRLCQRLAERGAAINRPGWSPLHYAASAPETTAVIDWLLSQGAAVNARSTNGSTPLMMAARYGSFDAVDRLLQAGADQWLINQQGQSAADFARTAGRDELAARLMR